MEKNEEVYTGCISRRVFRNLQLKFLEKTQIWCYLLSSTTLYSIFLFLQQLNFKIHYGKIGKLSKLSYGKNCLGWSIML